MKHLTEDILIQYQFELLDEAQRIQAREHLQSCEECRTNLSAIQQRFEVLNVLNPEEDLSQDLINKTLTQCRVGRAHQSRFRLGRLVSLSAAAAILIIGFVWTQSSQKAVRENLPSEVAFEDHSVDKLLAAKSEAMTEELKKPAALPLMAFNDRDGQLSESLTGQPRIVGTDEIPDKPPFAPASAIELVVLPRPEASQVTIYNSADLTLVRDTRKLTLKPGWNWLQFMWANTRIDPTSLSLRPLEHADKVDIQQLVFPARLREIGRWLIRSEVEGAVPFEITYFTSGLSWRAVYEGTLSTDERTMDLKGYVRVENNSGQDYVNAQTRLLLGQVRLLDEIKMLAERKYPYGPDVIKEHITLDCDFDDQRSRIIDELQDKGGLGGDLSLGRFEVGFKMKKVEKEGLSEYFLYTIEGTEDLPDTWGKRLESLDVENIPVKSLYKYDEERYGGQTVRFVSFKNDAEHELGQTPLPEGSIRIFRDLNAAQNLSYVGQSAFKYIPVNEDVELNMAASELVKIEPKRMDVKTANHIFDKDQNVSGWDDIETWQIKLTNTRDIPAEMEITRDFGTDYWELELQNSVGTAHPTYKKHDKRRARFTATLEPRSEKSFTYVVTRYQGQRSEYYVQKQKEKTP